MKKLKVSETDIKLQIKDLLGLKCIFSYPLTQGLGSYHGLPDRVIHYQGKVIYLEIKKSTGKLSEHQLAFQEQCNRDGIGYHVIHSLDELMEILGC